MSCNEIIDISSVKEICQAGEELIHLMIEQVKGQAMIMLGAAGHITGWNQAAERIMGYAAQEIIGEHVARFYPSECVQDGKPERDLQAALTEGQHDDEGWRMRKSGTRFWADATLTALHDADGQLRGFAQIIRDASQRKRAELALVRNEKRLRTIVDSIPECVATIAADGVLLEINAPGLAMLGIDTAEQIVGKSIFELVTSSCREAIQSLWERVFRGESGEAECEIASIRGKPRWIAVHASLLRNEAGIGLAALVVARDVTEHKRHAEEAQLRARQQAAIIDLSQRALLGDDLPAYLQRVAEVLADVLSTPFVKILQLLPDGQRFLLTAGVGWNDGYVGQFTVSTDVHLQAGFALHASKPTTVDGLRAFEPIVIDDVRSDKRFREAPLLVEHGIVSCLCVAIHGRNGPEGILGVHTTESRRFTADESHFLQVVANVLGSAIQRKRIEDALQVASRRKDEFLAVLAHELRNPLGVLTNALALVSSHDQSPADLQEIHQIMSGQCQSMTRLVSDLLDVARIGQGKVRLEIERLDVTSVIKKSVITSQPTLAAKQHELDIVLPEGQLFVEADPARLEQILVNLLNNAAKYTEPHGRIRVSAERAQDEVVLRVRDNGVGMAPEMLSQVFDLYAQAEHSLDRSQGGLGIGLSMVKQLVELHGGHALALSDGLGKGSEFVVRLPAAGRFKNEG
jgi:PAS domain S-box-containing protein